MHIVLTHERIQEKKKKRNNFQLGYDEIQDVVLFIYENIHNRFGHEHCVSSLVMVRFLMRIKYLVLVSCLMEIELKLKSLSRYEMNCIRSD